ncbi:hypothetical protein ATE68_01365 [Sphingopyxis sp. H038]|nr:hypothetical protein ATE78_01365 [Sphingopyxis sp. H012]KTE10832.1 hypothetical protein ATE76_12975 [Sphingopyxis sp. H093]KTE13471.1 hypothetical protein ATE70_02060 [Sphingopyxis sp. H053]KTE36817.1 hypothetical protein ATE68_01365 [Sphingopyxis sp. H038]KTE47143.1 hypothetical protein ATE77_02060 [Sphingopyxis sp. H005]KTE48375.1 hypothetical protein ATE73_03940 [Sphingopyxis sp. H077]KTE70024.1 hypothetical protein ATE74_06585 [Sphingopyxis sp. H085]
MACGPPGRAQTGAPPTAATAGRPDKNVAAQQRQHEDGGVAGAKPPQKGYGQTGAQQRAGRQGKAFPSFKMSRTIENGAIRACRSHRSGILRIDVLWMFLSRKRSTA